VAPTPRVKPLPSTGKAASPPSGRRYRLTSLRGVRKELAGVYARAHRGELDWAAAGKCAYVLTAIAKMLEGCSIEERIAALERRLNMPTAGRTINGEARRVEDLRP
jgi:hypothetical protein